MALVLRSSRLLAVVCLALLLWTTPVQPGGIRGEEGGKREGGEGGEGEGEGGDARRFESSKTYQEFIRRGTSSHTDNWAVLVCTSRFWFNYRHISNTLAVYRAVRRMGMPDSRIILMLADDMACNPRNSAPGSVFADDDNGLDLYGDNIEVDYRGYDVNVENFIRVLTGRHKPGTPPSKRLLSGPGSNVLIYMTGHGGDEFLKFQDAEEVSSRDLADSFQQMWEKRRYNEILFMVDTCQAGTLSKAFYSPRIIGVGSSQKGENSYSLGNNEALGVATSDRFTYTLLRQIQNLDIGSEKRLFDIFKAFTKEFLLSTPAYATPTWTHRPLKNVLVTDFFGATVTVETGVAAYPLSGGGADPDDSDAGEDKGGLRMWIGSGRGGGGGSVGFDLAREAPRARQSGLWAFSGGVAAVLLLVACVSLSSGGGSNGREGNGREGKGGKRD